MGIFKRISMIIRSNINALIDKAEEPEKMLEQIIADMIENMREIKLQIARSMRDEKMLERKVDENRNLGLEYEKKAELALGKSQDDLAREALKRKRSYQGIGDSLAKELEEQRKVVDMLKTTFKALEVKIEEAKAKRQVLLTRQKRAETQVDLSTTLNGVSEQADLLDSFERMADKVSRSEAMATSILELEKSSIEEKFTQLEQEKSVDDELKLLKEKIKTPAKQ